MPGFSPRSQEPRRPCGEFIASSYPRESPEELQRSPMIKLSTYETVREQFLYSRREIRCQIPYPKTEKLRVQTLLQTPVNLHRLLSHRRICRRSSCKAVSPGWTREERSRNCVRASRASKK